MLVSKYSVYMIYFAHNAKSANCWHLLRQCLLVFAGFCMPILV